MVKEFTILSIPVEPEKSVLDVLEGLWKSKRSRRSGWNGQRMRRCLSFGFQYYQKTCPVPNRATIGFSSFWLQGNNLGSITSFGVFTLTGVCENLVSCFPLWIHSIGGMTNVDCEVGVVSHRFASPPPCSRPKRIASRTKIVEKNIYEIKKRIYEKDPLNCWYSIQNRSKQNRITKSQQTFFWFFSQNRGYFPLFLLINIWNTISCRSGTAHPQRLRALLTGHNIYMYQIYRGTHRGAPLCVFTIQSTIFHSIFESRICK